MCFSPPPRAPLGGAGDRLPTSVCGGGARLPPAEVAPLPPAPVRCDWPPRGIFRSVSSVIGHLRECSAGRRSGRLPPPGGKTSPSRASRW
eukprot:535051-Prorocentrum_minimum.AAC.1